MRISDLSRRSDTPIPTIKFYLREGLLPPGTPRARNQADYHDDHLRRLRMIRALTGIGRLDLSSVRELLAAIDTDLLTLPELCRLLNRLLFAGSALPDDVDDVNVFADVDEFFDDLGWDVAADSSGRRAFGQVVGTLRLLGCDGDIGSFRPYAIAAEQLAIVESELMPPAKAIPDRAVMVVRSVLFEIALVAMRRIAQENMMSKKYGGSEST